MIIPRNWEPIMLQRSPEQTIEQAEPSATDVRFKIAGFILVICWCTIFVSLWHSIRHYESRNRGWFNRTIGFLGYMPFRFVLELPLLLGLVAYQILCSFHFRLSPLDAEDTNLVAMYVGGYAPSLLILIIQIADGFARPNEDRELMRQRRERGDQLNRDLGITKKPAWWRRVNGRVGGASMADQVLRNVQEVGGGRPTARQIERLAEQRAAQIDADAEATKETGPGRSGSIIEMSEMRRANSAASRRGTGTGTGRHGAPQPAAPPPYTPYGGKSDRRREERVTQAAVGLLFPSNGGAAPSPSSSEGRGRGGVGGGTTAGGPSSSSEPARQRPGGAGERSHSTGSAVSGVSTSAPPQQIRSMLDI